MSKIGKKPIIIPEGVSVKIDGQEVCATGPKGELKIKIRSQIKIDQKDNKIILQSTSNAKPVRALFGLFRSLVNNMVIGVKDGYKKSLQLHGLGYRVAMQATDDNKQKLVLQVGFSHTVEFVAPEGIKFSVNKNTIDIEGIDKQLVGETAATIRKIRPPEPYKGKGIRYSDEIVKKKQGKAVAKTTGA